MGRARPRASQASGIGARRRRSARKPRRARGKLAERAKGLAEEGNRGEGALPGETLELLQERRISDARRGSRARRRARGSGACSDEERRSGCSRWPNRRTRGTRSDARPAPRGGQTSRAKATKRGTRPSSRIALRSPRPKTTRGPRRSGAACWKGSGRPANPRMKDAVKRYAEGLLRWTSRSREATFDAVPSCFCWWL